MRRIPFVLLAFFIAAAALAADPQIASLSAVSHGDKVSLQFQLTGVFNDGDMVAALQSGAPTSFTYEIEIYRDRPWWFDETIGRSRVEVIATFNSVTREYLLNYRRDRKLVRSETFPDIARLEQRMTAIDEPDLFDIDGRRPYKLRVRVRADLWRSWRFYVIPWEVTTRWREARVKCPECTE